MEQFKWILLVALFTDEFILGIMRAPRRLIRWKIPQLELEFLDEDIEQTLKLGLNSHGTELRNKFNHFLFLVGLIIEVGHAAAVWSHLVLLDHSAAIWSHFSTPPDSRRPDATADM